MPSISIEPSEILGLGTSAQQMVTKHLPVGTCFTVADSIHPSIGRLMRALTTPIFGSFICLVSRTEMTLVRYDWR